MKTIAIAMLLTPLLLTTAASHADEPASAPKKPEPTQSELALDHGPHATVTPAVKRAREQAAKKAATEQAKPAPAPQ